VPQGTDLRTPALMALSAEIEAIEAILPLATPSVTIPFFLFPSRCAGAWGGAIVPDLVGECTNARKLGELRKL